MKKMILIASIVAASISSVAFAADDSLQTAESNTKRSEILPMAAKILSAVSLAGIFIARSISDKSPIKKSIIGGVFVTSLAGIISHGALLLRANKYRKVNKASTCVGLGAIIVPWVSEYLSNRNIIKRNYNNVILSTVYAIGAAKALYDGYEYYTDRSEDNLEDRDAASDIVS